MQTSDMTALQLEGIGYSSINTAFKKKVVFSVGYYAGFFSEINNMILAMIYCLKNNLKFTLNSKNSAIFGDKGWEEYFEPFTEEAAKPIPQKINFRITTNYKFRLKDLLRINLYKIQNDVNYLTFDIWDKFYDESWHHACDKQLSKERIDIINHIWKYTPETKSIIDNKIKLLNLPDKYDALHIRGGDKLLEAPSLYRPEDLIETLFHFLELKDIFIFCDDYSAYEYFVKNYKNYKFYTLCTPDERGYDNEKFQNEKFSMRRNKIINLLTDIEICKNANFFVGSEQANTDYFLSWIMNPQDFILLPWYTEKFYSNKEKYFSKINY